ncbi:ParB/RepB/Spo0J family partition protein [Nocardia otitidiscaviarum]|uniref:ParB/RepB/Spo0J family partition protein n=1 Tax=Nocardia otitidiscaviarum TaxID=1823 RepID=UPI00313B1152
MTDLIDSVGDHSPVDGVATRTVPAGPPTSAPLAELAANPRNPREDLGDLSELQSIATTQLQPALVVTRQAYLGLYPEDEDRIGPAQWIVINGCRRLAAAREFGRADLEFVVKDEVAASRVTLLAAAISENVDRRDFDVIEEARAVEAMVAECGTADLAAAQLQKSRGWVSQRRSLLALAPELQSALRRGDLAIREARILARVPRAEQVQRWLDSQNPKPDTSETDPKKPTPPTDAERIAKSLKKLSAKPDTLAVALTDYLDAEQLRTLVASLNATLTATES